MSVELALFVCKAGPTSVGIVRFHWPAQWSLIGPNRVESPCAVTGLPHYHPLHFLAFSLILSSSDIVFPILSPLVVLSICHYFPLSLSLPLRLPLSIPLYPSIYQSTVCVLYASFQSLSLSPSHLKNGHPLDLQRVLNH